MHVQVFFNSDENSPEWSAPFYRSVLAAFWSDSGVAGMQKSGTLFHTLCLDACSSLMIIVCPIP